MTRYLLSLSVCAALSACSVHYHGEYHAGKGTSQSSGSEVPANRDPKPAESRSGSREVVRVTVRPGSHHASTGSGTSPAAGGQGSAPAGSTPSSANGDSTKPREPVRVVTPGSGAHGSTTTPPASAGSQTAGGATSGNASSGGASASAAGTGGSASAAGTSGTSAGDGQGQNSGAATSTGSQTTAGNAHQTSGTAGSASGSSTTTSGSGVTGSTSGGQSTGGQGSLPSHQRHNIGDKTPAPIQSAQRRAGTDAEVDRSVTCGLYSTRAQATDLLRLKVVGVGEGQLTLDALKLPILRRIGTTWIVRLPSNSTSGIVNLQTDGKTVRCGRLNIDR